MPAFHRVSSDKHVEIEMQAGEYLIELEVEKGVSPLNVIVVPVGCRETETPGPNYFMTDIIFLPQQ